VRAVPAIGLRSDHGSDEIPASHRDLVQCQPVAALITVMPDGYPQTSVEWCDVDGGVRAGQRHAWLRKEHNMRRNPRVRLLCYDPRQPLRYLEVRGTVVEMTQAGVAEHLDQLASSYAGGRSCTSATPSGPLRRHRAPGPVPDPADPRHRARRPGEGGKEITTRVAAQALAIPALHLDLLTRPICGCSPPWVATASPYAGSSPRGAASLPRPCVLLPFGATADAPGIRCVL
jgi:hypothetical protein